MLPQVAGLAIALGLALALAAGARAQQLSWPQAPITGEPVAPALLLDHEKLRAYRPSGRLVATKRHGPLTLEVREAVAASGKDAPAAVASITVRLRNRLVAAATGYRLGGDFTYNGVQLEGWDGSGACTFLRWRLEFAGERLKLVEQQRLAQPACTAAPD